MSAQAYSRRSVLACAAALGATGLVPRYAFAQSSGLLAARSPALRAIGERLHALLQNPAARRVAGAVVAVSIGDEELVLVSGSANLNTGQPFTPDTGFLLGSVTKVLVTTIMLRLVERGLVDLDAPAQHYVPEFTLSDREAAARIKVRMLLNHTNGIDAHTLCPWMVRGREAGRSYTAYLPRVGALFEPGTCVTYSNPGFVVASRVIEEVTGLPFELAIRSELFGPAGMRDATAVQTQAFLRRTAIGAVPSPDGKELVATPTFTLGEGLAGGGTTAIVSPQDMLAFGRMHLRGGVAPNGTRVLSAESVEAMRTTSFDLGMQQAPPVGLGWWKFPIAGTTAFQHGGGSIGGGSSLCIVPDHDAVIVSFAAGPGAGGLNAALRMEAIEQMTGRSALSPMTVKPQPIPADVAGEYRILQDRVMVEVDGEELIMTHNYEPIDQEHRDFFEQMWGRGRFPPTRFRSIGEGLYAPVSWDPATHSSFGRTRLLAVLPATASRRMALHNDLNFIPKAS
ncbi:serine hydrolase domain-containing protein [Sphingosinicella rhizophila]|uniref:Serine hydrolase domain-containing protein n=1 Tax=Sphingosinicella rhizophila TaxID=3050082 RepID=A0ABU3Q5Y7_9SPHN|nr:serine hydrolase domain-containing protein [Sphingosinicella sp. GR2756]MDT9598722.1 serine hydrolase domain-containing protein [Sphingosinicella sp. GR2756]